MKDIYLKVDRVWRVDPNSIFDFNITTKTTNLYNYLSYNVNYEIPNEL